MFREYRANEEGPQRRPTPVALAAGAKNTLPFVRRQAPDCPLHQVMAKVVRQVNSVDSDHYTPPLSPERVLLSSYQQ